MFLKVSRTLALLLCLSGVMLFVNASPATAHNNNIAHGSDYAVVNSPHNSGYVCDLENDGRRAYVEVRFNTVPESYRLLWSYGFGQPCRTFGDISEPDTLPRWRICEGAGGYNDPCSKFENI